MGRAGSETRVPRRLSYTLLVGIVLSLLGIALTFSFKPPRANLILDFLGALLLTLIAVEAAVLLRQRGLRRGTPNPVPEQHEEHVIHLRCSRCQTQFERVDHGTRPLEVECPNCGLRVLLGVKRSAEAPKAAFQAVHKVVCIHCAEPAYVMDKPDLAAPAQLCLHCGNPLE